MQRVVELAQLAHRNSCPPDQRVGWVWVALLRSEEIVATAVRLHYCTHNRYLISLLFVGFKDFSLCRECLCLSVRYRCTVQYFKKCGEMHFLISKSAANALHFYCGCCVYFIKLQYTVGRWYSCVRRAVFLRAWYPGIVHMYGSYGTVCVFHEK